MADNACKQIRDVITFLINPVGPISASGIAGYGAALLARDTIKPQFRISAEQRYY